MIDRSWKLQRYDRKDYSELVEFPVEIVGRDGVVRRYSFEDSIRLYQRRVSFAPVRYSERELADAELAHCRSRIEQLRRSYFQRYGWASEPGGKGPEVTLKSLSGELAAFLCRVLRVEGRIDVRIEALGSPTAEVGTWYVTPAGARTGMLLYVFRFDGSNPEPARERFFRQVKELERTGAGDGDTERLLAFHHTLDCAFILSGDAVAASVVDASAGEASEPDQAATPWDDVVDAIRVGDRTSALSRCRQIVVEQPWHRQAYTAGAVIALETGELVVAEELTHLGVKYFPGDSHLRYYLTAVFARQGRLAEAEAAARQMLALDQEFLPGRYLLAQMLVRRGSWSEVRKLLRVRGTSEDPRIQRAVRRLAVRALVRPVAGVVLGVTILAAVLAFAIQFALLGVGLAGAAAATTLGLALSTLGWGTEAVVQLEDPTVGLRRLVRRDVGALVS